jgi:hypothetical protein
LNQARFDLAIIILQPAWIQLMFYDISGTIKINQKITSVVLREQLAAQLQSLSAQVALSDQDGALEFMPQGKRRGSHPLKNITAGRISLAAENPDRLYTTAVRYQLSLFQVRLGLVLATLFIFGYSLLRGYPWLIPVAMVTLSWVFGYGVAIFAVRSQFQSFIRQVAAR